MAIHTQQARMRADNNNNGAHHMYTLNVSPSNGTASSTIFVKKPICTIGESEDNIVTLKGRKIAKVHAQLEFRDDGIHISNRATFKPLFVNDNKVENFGPITVNDIITIGDYQISIALANKDPNITVSSAPAITSAEALKKAYRHWQQLTHKQVKQLIQQNTIDIHGETANADVRSIVQSVVNDHHDLPNNIDPAKLAQRVHGEIIGFGALEPLMSNPQVSEIMVNNYDEIFYEESGKTKTYGGSFTDADTLLDIIKRMVAPTGRRIDHQSPMIDARLKNGSRINAVIPPLAVKGPSLTIRKAVNERLSAQHLINYETLNPAIMRFLEMAVIHKCNIIISGSTGSGKSTLLNVLSSFIPNNERVIVIEDAAELELLQPNLVSLESRPADADGSGAIEIRDLVKNSLRMNPDRIVVGECRGGEALDMLQAMNTGHNGSLTTIHANSPRDCISRLEVLSLLSGVEIPMLATRTQIASSIDIIVQQTRFPCGSRRITSISEVSGMESNNVQLGEIFTYRQEGVTEQGKIKGRFEATGFIPTFYESLKERGITTDLSIFQ